MRITLLALLICPLALFAPPLPGQSKKKADPVVEGKPVGEWAKALAGKELAAASDR